MTLRVLVNPCIHSSHMKLINPYISILSCCRFQAPFEYHRFKNNPHPQPHAGHCLQTPKLVRKLLIYQLATHYRNTCNLLEPDLILSKETFANCVSSFVAVGPKKKIVMLPSPDQNLKIGSVGRFFFFFFFFFTYRERVEFSNIFFKVSKWGKLGRNAVKTHISAFLSH